MIFARNSESKKLSRTFLRVEIFAEPGVDPYNLRCANLWQRVHSGPSPGFEFSAGISLVSKHNDDLYQSMRNRIRNWLAARGKGYSYAEYLLFGPDLFHLLSKLVLDERVAVGQKVKLAAAIAYFISPIDLIPESILGPAAYIDDIALAAYVLSAVINAGKGGIAREHWAGKDDLLIVIQRVLEIAESAIGTGVWARLRGIGDKGWASRSDGKRPDPDLASN